MFRFLTEGAFRALLLLLLAVPQARAAVRIRNATARTWTLEVLSGSLAVREERRAAADSAGVLRMSDASRGLPRFEVRAGETLYLDGVAAEGTNLALQDSPMAPPERIILTLNPGAGGHLAAEIYRRVSAAHVGGPCPLLLTGPESLVIVDPAGAHFPAVPSVPPAGPAQAASSSSSSASASSSSSPAPSSHAGALTPAWVGTMVLHAGPPPSVTLDHPARTMVLLPQQYHLLKLLAEAPGQTQSIEALERGMAAAMAGRKPPGMEPGSSFIFNLRQRLEEVPGHPRALIHIRRNPLNGTPPGLRCLLFNQPESSAAQGMELSGPVVLDFLDDHFIKLGTRLLRLNSGQFHFLALLAAQPGEEFAWKGLAAQAGLSQATQARRDFISTLRDRLEADPRHPRFLLDAGTQEDKTYRLAGVQMGAAPQALDASAPALGPPGTLGHEGEPEADGLAHPSSSSSPPSHPSRHRKKRKSEVQEPGSAGSHGAGNGSGVSAASAPDPRPTTP